MALGRQAVTFFGNSAEQVIRNLEQGDIDFILDAQLPAGIPASLTSLRPLNQIHPQAAFFSALLIEAAETQGQSNNTGPSSIEKKNLLFAVALESPSPSVRREAAEKLILTVLEESEGFAREVLNLLGRNTEDEMLASLRAACLYRLGRFADAVSTSENYKDVSAWNQAFNVLANWKNSQRTAAGRNNSAAIKHEAIQFFLTRSVDSTWHWAMKEFEQSAAEFFTAQENAAFSLREAVSRSAFPQAIQYYHRISDEKQLADGENFLLGGGLFFQYPELVVDLGRSFQFAPGAAREGIELFSAWKNSADLDNNQYLRYLLSYFIGRIERSQAQYARSNAAFQIALELAPDSLRADACIWYMLTNALNERPATAAAMFKTYIPRMSSMPYFDDVLDQLSQYLVTRKDWKTMEEIFILLATRNSNGAAVAQYAWILGRAVEQYSYKPVNTVDFFRIAFDRGNHSLYYRAMSAHKLGAAFIPETVTQESNAAVAVTRPEMEFLLGFFNFSAADLALPYIRKYEDSLTIPELRILAAAMAANSGIINESLNLVSRYMDRDDFIMTREDLCLFYPQPFKELIEKYARQMSLAPELLFGLIRTESYFKADIGSRSGAVGLSQLMQDTAMDMAGRIARSTGPDYRTPDGVDLTNPETNVHIGSFYLNYLIDYTGSPMTALIAYNGGMGRVRHWRAAEPSLPEDIFLETIEIDETREYGRRVLAAAAIYGYLYYDMSMEQVVADIYR